MSVWRKKAIELFPELRQELHDHQFNPYSLFFELLPLVRTAHEVNDQQLLKKIYGFAEWCLKQSAKDLWNPAGVCFYEHLFDCAKVEWPMRIPWLSPAVIRNCWPLWEARLDPTDLEKLRVLIAIGAMQSHRHQGVTDDKSDGA